MTYQDIVAEAKRLPLSERLQLLAEISQSLVALRTGASSASTPGPALMLLAGTLTAEDAAQMRAAIEADCEQINTNAW